MFKRFPVHLQHDSIDCGAACLTMVSTFYGRKLTQETLRELCHTTRIGVSMLAMSRAAEQLGFRTTATRMSLSEIIKKQPFPCILHWNQEHFVVLYRISYGFFSKRRTYFHIADPVFGRAIFTKDDLKEHWLSTVSEGKEKGVVLALEPTNLFFDQKDDAPTRQGFRRLSSYFIRYKLYFTQIGIGILIGSLLQLIFPFLTQAIVDIGIGNRNLSFIYLVLLAQSMLILSRTAVEYVKRWLLLHVSVRINLSLISDFFVKLMKLPMRYYDTRSFGDILQRLSDHERVEAFITTRSLQAIFSDRKSVV